MTLNVRSFRSSWKRILFEAMIDLEDYDVITLTETWLTDEFTDGMLAIDGYHLAVRAERKKRLDDKPPGGGVAIYVKKSIKFHSPLAANIYDYGQIASIKIKDTQIMVVYRKPNNDLDLDTKVKEFVASKAVGDNVVITGDINLPHTDWDQKIFPSRPSRIWAGLCEEIDLHQHIREPTHELGNQLDCLFSRGSNNDLIRSHFIDSDLTIGFCDHFVVVFHVNVSLPNNVQRREIFDFRRIDWEIFREKIGDHKIIPKCSRDPESSGKWQTIRGSLESSREVACPKIVVIDGRGPKWISLNLKRKMRKEQRLRELAKVDTDNVKVKNSRVKKWKFHKNSLHKDIKKARISYEDRLISENEKDVKTLFTRMKKAKRNVNIPPPINDMDGHPLISDKSKADAFQDHFMKVFTKPDDSRPPIQWEDNWGLNEVTFTVQKIKKAVQKMNRSAAPGDDSLGPALLKEAHLSVAFALTDLFNNLMDKSDFPDDFLVSKVVPLWKQKGSKSDLKTYRQVSLGNSTFKVGESVVVDEINDHLDAHGLNDVWQHGFMPRKSTITNLIDTWEFLSHEVDKGHSWVSLSLDFSSAFDKISIQHLLKALWNRGIGGKLGIFIETWLTQRMQYVQVGESKSYKAKCPSGVPQGSLGGPRFFCTVLSDVFKNLTTEGADIELKIACYADDSRLIFKVRDLRDALAAQRIIDNMCINIKEAGLVLNASKSIIVRYGRNNFDYPIKIDGATVQVANSSIELGCIFSNSMSFKDQLEKNLNKGSNVIFMIRHLFKVRSYKILKTLYYTYFCSVLMYSVQLWFTPFKYVKEALHRIFRKFWRLGNGIVVPGDDILDPYQLAIKHSLVFLYQMKMGENCLEFEQYFDLKESGRTRSEKNEEINVKRANHTYRSNCFSIHIANRYNKLPLEIRQSKSVAIFKNKVSEHLKKTEKREGFDYTPLHLKVRRNGY